MITKKVYKIERLPDTSLEKVSGGLNCVQTATVVNVGVYTAIGTGLGAVACTIASAVCSSVASKAQQQSDMEKNIKYNDAAKYLSIAASSLGSVGIAAAVTNFCVSSKHGKTCTKCGIGKPPTSYSH